jgi:uncharacterized protein (DUF427 family)
VSLTVGTGPFGRHPEGTLNFEPPDPVVLVQPLHRRVRALKDGAVAVDSDRVVLVYVSGRLPRYGFPPEDVRPGFGHPDRDAEGYVRVNWADADQWFEEDEEVFVHPRDLFHRIDVLPTTRLVRVRVDGVELASSARARALYETGLPVRYSLPRDDVRMDLLERSDTVTQCAYKGSATHWSGRVGDTIVPDVAWSYDDIVRRDGEQVIGMIAFYNERTDIEVDEIAQERPVTPWSR